ncbi:LANO_0G07558g1_1 [Lachancea nothofagi CBS 11611]|uniref:LANO_0G07558g1_1 n=1 Tax=Lachancea nothofagi CBS 11611 TaxID=1266666 RepID=A0A1G4KHQ9_9SACH|nr:LANO_0G07558g1_1 [Lachancea nothofagi CBS 11611]
MASESEPKAAQDGTGVSGEPSAQFGGDSAAIEAPIVAMGSAQLDAQEMESGGDLETAKPTSAPHNTPEPSPGSGYPGHGDAPFAGQTLLPPPLTGGDPSIEHPPPRGPPPSAGTNDSDAGGSSASPNLRQTVKTEGKDQYLIPEPRRQVTKDEPRAAVITDEEKAAATTKKDGGTVKITKHEEQMLAEEQNKTQDAEAAALQLPHISTLLSLPRLPDSRHASPNSILTRRNVFATSASRYSPTESAKDEERLPLRGASFSGSSSTSGLVSGTGRTFLTPHRLSFNTHRMATDPHVTLDHNNKINISSLLNSRGEDMYTLRSREQLSSSPAFQALLNSGSRGGDGHGGAAVDVAVDDDDDDDDDEDDDDDDDDGDNDFEDRSSKRQSPSVVVVPPPASQPKRVKSKLDELRSRVLLDPNANPLRPGQPDSSSSPRTDDESAAAGAAAAIISRMRSSPYAAQNDESNQSSRPGSASFRHHMRPIVRIHQREYDPDDSDESAVIEDDTEDESYEELPRRGSDKISWNKSGMKKRVTRRQSAPSANLKRRHSIHPDNNSVSASRTSRHSSTSSASTVTSLLSAAKLLGRKPTPTTIKDENQKTKTGKESSYESPSASPKDNNNNKPRRKNASGSRSRSGCWICRLRKKKCTEEKPSCHNCLRLNLQCFYDHTKPDFISDPAKKNDKLEEIKKKTKEAKRMAMRRRP